MNIDIHKFQAMNHLVDDCQILRSLTHCRIEPVGCAGCDVSYNSNLYPCDQCTDNPDLISHYVPKRDDLGKLFVGAPVMVRNTGAGINSVWSLREYRPPYKLPLFAENYRLPTVEEAPRNVWLAPWLELPDTALDGKSILLRLKDNEIATHPPIKFCKNYWKDVVAIMILEDFK